MNGVLKDLEPLLVFKYFEAISDIPRCSGDEKAVSDYCVRIAKQYGCEVIQDEYNNVIIKKTGTKGYEQSAPIILQGHLDMVCEKNSDVNHDFSCEALDLIIDGDFVKAKGTTLGGDNGIAIAICLALVEANNIKHPPLEMIFTVDEEVGLLGALSVNCDNIKGRKLINLDGGNENTFTVGCAGGLRDEISLPVTWSNRTKNHVISLNVKGLKGGHSGVDIILQRANANKLLIRLLDELRELVDYEISEINGGSKDNAIPREACAILAIDADDVEKMKEILKEQQLIIENEYKYSEDGIEFFIEDSILEVRTVFSDCTVQNVLFIGTLLPCGVQAMSLGIKDLVETSCNFGVLITNDDEIIFRNSIRSSLQSKKEEIVNIYKKIAKATNSESVSNNEYPGWEFNLESDLLKMCTKVFENMYKESPNAVAVHAGLECGVFAEKISNCDMISFSPNMYDFHSPDESLSISSTKKVWEFLIAILKEMK